MRHAPLFALALLLLAACEREQPSDANTEIYLLGDERIAPVTDPPMPAPGESTRSWATSDWTPAAGTTWIPYGGRQILRIQHDLGRTPAGVLVYLSFTEDGRNPALAAGDLARLPTVDADFVEVWNDTNGNYFARVVVF